MAAETGNWFAFDGDAAKSTAGTGDNWASVFDSQPQTTSQPASDGWSAAFSSQTTASTSGANGKSLTKLHYHCIASAPSHIS